MKKHLATFVFTVFLTLLSKTACAQLVITELMQSNITYFVDDLNEFPDSWVELYNAGENTEQLSDYQIGIKKKIDKAYSLPSMEIKPGEYVMVLCDKGETGLHTSFRLESNKAGEVYLFKNGTQIASVSHPAFPSPDIAYGLDPQTGEWGYEFIATPGMPNIAGICEETKILPAPIFSQAGCITTDPFKLTLSVPETAPSGTVIRYTLDGTMPTAESEIFNSEAELSIENTTIIRTRLFCDGWLSPYPTTQSYIFPDHEITLPIISIVTDNSYLYSDELGILSKKLYTDNVENYEHDWRRPINIEFFFDHDASSINQLCETRVAGGASRVHPLKTLAIYANKRFGEKELNYEFFPDQKPGITNFKSLLLRNAGNDFSSLYMRDAAIQMNIAKHSDLDWQAYRPSVVFVNGEYVGILNIRERSNDDNIITNYDGLEDIHMFENWYELKAGDHSARREFRDFYSIKGHSLEEYNQVMDVEEFTNVMLTNIFYNNFDFPCNNIVMWRPVADGGRWRWIAKDTDFCLGIYGIKSDFQIFNWYSDNNFHGHYNWGNQSYGTILFLNMLENEDYLNKFIDTSLAYLGDFINLRGTAESLDYCYNLIRDEFPYHSALYDKTQGHDNHTLTPEEFDDELENTKQWVADRHEFFYDHMAEYFNLGKPVSLNIAQPEHLTRSNSPDVSFKLNDIAINYPSFDGKYFQGRKMSVSATPTDEDNVITGWVVRSYDNNGLDEKMIEEPNLEMTMPECDSMEIRPILAKLSSVSNVSIETEENCPNEYFDLNGCRINPSDLRPGIYIVKRGNNVTKQIIKGN